MKYHALIKIFVITISTFLLSSTAIAQAEPPSEQNSVLEENTAETANDEQTQYLNWAQETWDKLDRQTGQVNIPEASVTLNIPEDFYFLGPKDSVTVLVDVWGNPPGQAPLGMLFPADMTPFDAQSWAVTIDYEEEGYVSDEDADKIDYDDLLKEMKGDTRSASEERIKQGYSAIELVGWASPPYYDKNSHKLHWAKEIKFGDAEVNTLNYNIRILGRKGVLVMNFIAGIDQKALIDSKLDNVLALAEFDQGSTYSDFDPDVDKVAAYGIGALVAGKIAAKTGVLAIVIMFLKKFGIIILVGIGALFKAVFSRRKN